MPEDVFNRFLVCATTDAVLIGIPPLERLKPVDALILAAWLVAIAEPMSGLSFDAILREVQNT